MYFILKFVLRLAATASGTARFKCHYKVVIQIYCLILSHFYLMCYICL